MPSAKLVTPDPQNHVATLASCPLSARSVCSTESSLELTQNVCAKDQAAALNEVVCLQQCQPDAAVAVVHAALTEEGQRSHGVRPNDLADSLIPCAGSG